MESTAVTATVVLETFVNGRVVQGTVVKNVPDCYADAHMLEGQESEQKEVIEQGLNYTAARHDSAAGPPRFIRRTVLRADEYHKNFRQIDADVIAAVTSVEADGVTPLMSKVYLRLVSAPVEFWEREGVLYFTAKEADGRLVKASKVLYELLGVASATAHKALQWMHGQGIIGYFAGKNGAGIRIFINRASDSIGVRTGTACKKILPFSRGSNGGAAGSAIEPAFNDSFAVSEILETDLNLRAPKSGAAQTEVLRAAPDPHAPLLRHPSQDVGSSGRAQPHAPPRIEVPVAEIVSRLMHEIEPTLQSAARQAAVHEHERTREWLERRGLPKAARVAQREAYNVLRRHGVLVEAARTTPAGLGGGDYAPPMPRALADDEIEELAHACLALLETKGQSVEATLSGMSVAAGGFLLPEDAPCVRLKVQSLISGLSAEPEGREVDD